MGIVKTYPRLNIYLDAPELREQIRLAAAKHQVTISAYCVEAIRRRLAEDGFLPPSLEDEKRRAAAQALDRLRTSIGPIGMPVSELIEEGRRR
ncbi:MAG: hypothetical protein DRI61_06265 [Chloroflexi bacterium]|nr:MAG: hypothetical protein DRI61_06265 [Chloroflexota bacterium]HDN79196.1 hypothetical protein [Chloroflexota bacterium]